MALLYPKQLFFACGTILVRKRYDFEAMEVNSMEYDEQVDGALGCNLVMNWELCKHECIIIKNVLIATTQ